MAGGKQSPRQKMINLMYLVFIAMLALNMSKEVLQAFGLIDENLAESNVGLTAVNEASLASLQSKAGENAKQYAAAAQKAKTVSQVSDTYYQYLEGLKKEMEATLDPESLKDYQTQDKTDFLDEKFFVGDKLSPEGEKFVSMMNTYKSEMKAALGEGYDGLVSEIETKFKNGPVKDREGIEKSYMDYNYKGYPLIASKTKMTLLQNEIKNIESDVLSQFLQGELVQIASVNNYEAIVVLDKSAFFNGETVTGKVVLGRYDDRTVPNKVVLNGATIPSSAIKGGQVPVSFGSGSVGEKTISGEMQFVEDGKTVTIPIKGSYAVIPRPNSATISADKMNVVYRGVDNPMTVSFAGVPENKVSVNAPGLSRSGNGYVMRPGSGTEVTISVTGELPDGKKVSDSKKFRIKNLPRATGMVAGEYENVKKGRQSLSASIVSAKFLDFDFELTPVVKSFLFKVPGKPAIPVSGNRLTAAAQGNLRTARKGDLVEFAKINVSVPGVNIGSASGVTVELTD
ncbi:MAG: gliding motility protein GldM [Nonlabens sp.]|nr:gliding motility protein GldM [Nonlabens sp.]